MAMIQPQGQGRAQTARTQTQDLITIEGTVTRIYYSNESFSAGVMQDAEGRNIPFNAKIPLQQSQPVRTTGRYIQHAKYGRQFSIVSAELDLEINPDGMVEYLANAPEFSGIGYARAEKLVETYGADLIDAIKNDIDEVYRVTKIPINALQTLVDVWGKSAAVNAIMSHLAALGITITQARKLVDKYGDSALTIIEDNPYTIVGEIDGLGFGRVDKIAMATGIERNDPRRIRAGITATVQAAEDFGHCWIGREELIGAARELLVIDAADADRLIRDAIIWQLAARRAELVNDGGRISTRGLRDAEMAVSEYLKSNRAVKKNRVKLDVSGLAERQALAVTNAATNTISLTTGGAGTGKTHAIKNLVDAYEGAGFTVALCAPTGKAARRLSEATGRRATTIHVLLGFNPQIGFPDATLDCDLLVVDEVSMLDSRLAATLFRAVSNTTQVLLVGDHNQLPPVGAGNLLRDIYNTRPIPVTILDEGQRQSGILDANSMHILDGIVPPTSKPVWYKIDKCTSAEQTQQVILDMYDSVLEANFDFDMLKDVQLLTPMRRGAVGTIELNKHLQKLFQWKYRGNKLDENRQAITYYPGDKVIQNRNDYEIGVMNGTIGYVEDVLRSGIIIAFETGQTVEVKYGTQNYRDLSLAYALTIHKSQGSEFPCSIVVMHKSQFFMHNRNLLYTGVTRATKTAIIVGDKWAIDSAARREYIDNRRTFLSGSLKKISGA